MPLVLEHANRNQRDGVFQRARQGGFIHLPDDIAIGDTFTVDGQLYPDPLTLRVVDVRQQSESTFPDSPQIYVYAEVASP